MVVVLSFAFVFMSFLCAQQARTISSQRTLIQSLFQDSLELNAIKVHLIQQKQNGAVVVDPR
ncbi:MAG: hypothetical protein ACRD3E_16500 [Terriglobales bacterium]